MQDLLAVDIAQRIRELVHDLAAGLRCGIVRQEAVQPDPVDIVHHDAGAQFVVDLFGIGFHDIRMVQLHHQGILFLQEFQVSGLAAVFGFQAFQDEPPPLAAHLHQAVETGTGQFLIDIADGAVREELPVNRA